MHYIYSIILVLIGVGLSLFGLKYFRLSFPIAYAIHTLAFLEIIGINNLYGVIFVLIISILIFLRIKFLTYLYGWFFIFSFIAIPLAILFVYFKIELKSSAYLIIGLSVMMVALIATIILRKHLKAIITGIFSGFSIGVGISGFLFAELMLSGKIYDAFILPGVLAVAGIIFGVLFQYLFIIKNNPELIYPALKLNQIEPMEIDLADL